MKTASKTWNWSRQRFCGAREPFSKVSRAPPDRYLTWLLSTLTYSWGLNDSTEQTEVIKIKLISRLPSEMWSNISSTKDIFDIQDQAQRVRNKNTSQNEPTSLSLHGTFRGHRANI